MDLAVILLMLLLSAFFSGSEIAFVVANRLRVEVFAHRAGFVGTVVRDFLHNPSKFLTTTLVGNNIALVVYSTLTAFYLAEPLHHFFTNVLAFHDTGLDVAILATQTVIASFVVLIFGEILPKSLMREMANQAIFVLAVPLRVSYYLLLPMVKVAAWSASVVIRLTGADAESFARFIRRDFEIIIQESKASGELELDEEESELLSNVFALSTIRVKESMVPRTDIIAIEERSSIEDLQRRFIETGHSKLPVYRDNIDHIVGLVFAYDLFSQPESIEQIIRPAHFVPESKRSKDLLRDFLSTSTSIAVVIDEYGGTAGLVTREDLLEELFGDIQDEFDTDLEVLRQTGEDTYIASGRVRTDEVEENFGIELPEGDYETIAGYLLDCLGTIPAQKEAYDLGGYRFQIIKASANRIDLVRITRLPAEEG
jgi:putative hemolysin